MNTYIYMLSFEENVFHQRYADSCQTLAMQLDKSYAFVF